MTERKLTKSPTVSRRAMLGGTAGAISVLGLTASPAKALGVNDLIVQMDGTNETVALAKETVDHACVQHTAVPIDPADPQPGINRNLKRMVTLIDEHAHWAGPADLLSLSEFPMSGHAGWTKDEMLAIAIELPGKETEVLAAKAREHDMWLTFGCYARDPDWPGHVVKLGVLMDPNGQIVAKHWMTPSIYDVLPRYVEMYGWDEVIPIARTPVGNISITGVQYDPLLFSAMALKGCELCVRQATGSNPSDDALITSRYNNYFTSVVSNSISPGTRSFPDSAGGYGVTQIIGPNGKPLAKAWGSQEEIVRAKLPLAAYRKTKRLLDTMKDAAGRFYGGGRWG